MYFELLIIEDSGGAKGCRGCFSPLLLCNLWSPPKLHLQFSTMNQKEEEKNEEEEEEKKERGRKKKRKVSPPKSKF